MNETEIPADEIGLLDIVVVIAENWRLLVIAPLLAGIVAYFGFSSTSPQQFRSEAILRTDATGVATLLMGRVLDGPILESELFDQSERSLSRARHVLVDERLRIIKVNDTSLYRVSLIDNHSPEESRRFLADILNSAISNSKPTEIGRKLLELRARQHEIALEELHKSLERINKIIENRLGSELGSIIGIGELSQAAVTILSNVESRRVELANIQKELSGSISEADIIQPALLIYNEQPRGFLVRVVLVMLGVGVFALMAAFLRDGFRKASQDSGSSDVINRIRRAFWMKPLPPKQTVS